MAINFNYRSGLHSGSCNSSCSSKDGCPSDYAPDFVIRRHDTKPPFKVAVSDCDGPLDLRGLVVEVNMWAIAKLKAAIEDDAEYFRLADDIGFQQVMVGDIIVMDQIRNPEHMLVVGFDEHNKLVKVERGYHGSTATYWAKGSKMRIFRILNGVGESEMTFEDETNVEGKTTRDVLQESYLVYEWQPEDTCLPGCFWLEFKLLKMIAVQRFLPGGNWDGETHEYDDGFRYTGTAHTDSTVKLSYDQVNDLYLIPGTPWMGESHQHTDDQFYTGTTHDDGSVLLNKTGVPSGDGTAYNEDGLKAHHDVSVIPSFTDESLTPADFGCTLGEGVEWARRFPTEGEGFLIKVEFSPTTEL